MDWYKKFKEMNDDELSSWVSSNAQLGSNASNLAIAELSRRSIVRNEQAVRNLEQSINKFSKSSESYSKKLLVLTLVLVALTIILAIPMVTDIIEFFKQVFQK